VCLRVPSVRAFAAQTMLELVVKLNGFRKSEGTLRNNSSEETGDYKKLGDLLHAAAWIICEYSALLGQEDISGNDSSEGDLLEMAQGEGADENQIIKPVRKSNLMSQLSIAAEVLFCSDKLKKLKPHIQTAFIHNALKLVVTAAKHEYETIAEHFGNNGVSEESRGEWRNGLRRVNELGRKISRPLNWYCRSDHIEVQERAVFTRALFKKLNLCSASENNVEERTSSVQDNALLLHFAETESRLHDKADFTVVLEESGDPMKELGFLKTSLMEFIEEDIKPVNAMAQESVPLPTDFDIEQKLLDIESVESYIAKRDNEMDEEPVLTGGALNVSFGLRVSSTSNTKPVHAKVKMDHLGSEKWLQHQKIAETISARNADSRSSCKNKNQRIDDPFYLPSSRSVDNTAIQHSDDLAGRGIPVVRLEDGSLGEIVSADKKKENVNGSHMMGLSASYLNSIASCAFENNMDVVRDDAMPAGATSEIAKSRTYSQRKKKDANLGSDDDITLADIDVNAVSDTGMSNESGDEANLLFLKTNGHTDAESINGNVKAISKDSKEAASKQKHKKKHKKKHKHKRKSRKEQAHSESQNQKSESLLLDI